jgi:hypothetical protein
MRLLAFIALVATLGVPAPAVAQTRGHCPPPTASIPPIGLPLPQIGMPLPGIGLPPLNNGSRQIVPFHDGEFPGTAFARARNHGTVFEAPVVRRPFVGVPVIVYVVPQYVIPVAPLAPAQPAREQIERQPATGSLVLQVEPGTAQVFVDGYYFGMPEDFDGRRGELALDPRPHNIELMAPGYESVSFDVRIAANQRVKYQNAMKPAAVAPPPPPAAPIAPKTFYLVPGCYLGDVPPKDAGLPATCDVTRAVTFAR